MVEPGWLIEETGYKLLNQTFVERGIDLGLLSSGRRLLILLRSAEKEYELKRYELNLLSKKLSRDRKKILHEDTANLKSVKACSRTLKDKVNKLYSEFYAILDKFPNLINLSKWQEMAVISKSSDYSITQSIKVTELNNFIIEDCFNNIEIRAHSFQSNCVLQNQDIPCLIKESNDYLALFIGANQVETAFIGIIRYLQALLGKPYKSILPANLPKNASRKVCFELSNAANLFVADLGDYLCRKRKVKLGRKRNIHKYQPYPFMICIQVVIERDSLLEVFSGVEPLSLAPFGEKLEAKYDTKVNIDSLEDARRVELYLQSLVYTTEENFNTFSLAEAKSCLAKHLQEKQLYLSSAIGLPRVQFPLIHIVLELDPWLNRRESDAHLKRQKV